MFHINFFNTVESIDLSDSKLKRTNQIEPFVCQGGITIGSFVEQFESPLHFWRKKDYENQWLAALSRLITGSEKTALITAMYDPAVANFLIWWPLYREKQIIFVQNQLLFLKKLNTPFKIATMDDFVKPRRTVNDEGDKISEWSISLSDIRKFLKHRKL